MSELRWQPLQPGGSTIWSLQLGSDELARIARRVDGRGWLSEVARHRRDYRRRMSVLAPSLHLAQRWAERWTRANLERIRAELPTTVAGRGCSEWVWPASNPAFAFRPAASGAAATPNPR